MTFGFAVSLCLEARMNVVLFAHHGPYLNFMDVAYKKREKVALAYQGMSGFFDVRVGLSPWWPSIFY
jgi:hypothetical protein